MAFIFFSHLFFVQVFGDLIVVRGSREETAHTLCHADLHGVESDEVHRAIVDHLLLDLVDELDALCGIKGDRELR